MTTLRMHGGASLFAQSCLNCRANLVGDFCHLCGQSAKTARITLPAILAQLPDAIWTLNRALPYTLLNLAHRPGHLIRDYIEGRRQRIYSPIALLFFVSGIVGLLTGWFHVSDAGLQAVGQMHKEQLELGEKIVDYYAWIVMLTVPLQAVGPWIIFRKRLHFTFGEHLMIAALIGTGTAIVGATALPVEWLLKRSHHTGQLAVILTAFELAKIAYMCWAYSQLQEDGKKQESAFMRWGLGLMSFVTNIAFWTVAGIGVVAAAIITVVVLRAYYHF